MVTITPPIFVLWEGPYRSPHLNFMSVCPILTSNLTISFTSPSFWHPSQLHIWSSLGIFKKLVALAQPIFGPYDGPFWRSTWAFFGARVSNLCASCRLGSLKFSRFLNYYKIQCLFKFNLFVTLILICVEIFGSFSTSSNVFY